MRDGTTRQDGGAAAKERSSLAPIRSRYANWHSLSSADGEYRDFTKFDFEKAEKERLGDVEFEVVEKEAKEKNIRLTRLSQLRAEDFSSLLLQAPGLLPHEKQDKLLAWHGAHVQDGWVLRVPTGADAGFIHLRTQATGHSALHHVLVLEKGAKAQVIIESIGKESSNIHLHTDVTEALLGPDAALVLTTVQHYGPKDWAFSHHDQRLDGFSKLTHAAVALGAEVSRTRTLNRLVGSHSQTHAYQLFLGRNKQFMDMETSSHHQVPDTQGEMTCRGALDDHALGVYRGHIHIDRAGTNTISHQSGSALLLSEETAANIIPSLQVDNDQVEAGHGATIGGLDEKELFYLRSRGLDEPGARRLVMEGYYQALIGKIPSARTQERLRSLFAENLPAYHAESKKRIKMQVVANPGLEARPRAHEGIKGIRMDEGSD